MPRNAQDFFEEMSRKNTDPFRMLAVARAVRGGNWYDEVLELLLSSGKITKEMIDSSREKSATVLKDRWKTERVSEIRRVADEQRMAEKRASKKKEIESKQ